MHQRSIRTVALDRFRRLVFAVAVAMVVASGTTASAGAQWPTSCVDLNDVVEAHLGNHANVGIYQRVFGDQAEDACQSDHLEDVRGVFVWALTDSSLSGASDGLARADIGGWPTTCMELNDIVEARLGNHHNVTIYQRTFAAEAESACRNDHRADIREVFAWAACDPRAAASAVQTTGRAPPGTPPHAVATLAQADSGLRNVLAAVPWLACHTYTWLADGVSSDDRYQLQQLTELTFASEQAGIIVANSAWFGEGIDYDDPYRSGQVALRSLRDLSSMDPALRNIVFSYPWITDDMTDNESAALRRILRISDQDLPFAIRLADTGWIRDGIANYEDWGLDSIDAALENLTDGGRGLIEYALQEPLFTSDLAFIREVYGIRFGGGDIETSNIEAYNLLRSQPWFMDGLNAEERAFIQAIGSGSANGPHYADAVRSYYAQSSTIAIPGTGTVRLWAFQHEPFEEGENPLGTVAQGLLSASRIMGTALPTNDVVVYLTGYHGAAEFPNRLILPRPNFFSEEFTRDLIFETVAKLYLDYSMGPHYPAIDSWPVGSQILFETAWLENSGSAFVRAFTNDWLGTKSILDQNHEWAEYARVNCTDKGLASIYTISRLAYPGDTATARQFRDCTEAYGRLLLLRLYLTIGEERMSAALGELHHMANYNYPRENDEGIRIPSEKEVFRTFMQHTPSELHDDVQHWYRQYHGAPFIFYHG